MSLLKLSNRVFALLLMTAVLFSVSCTGASETSDFPSATPRAQPVVTYGYKVAHTYPHDTGAFTEGLVFEDDILYESTGLRGNSSLRKVELETGKILQKYELSAEYFGEGMTLYGDTVIQLTWQSHKGFVYQKGSLNLLRDFGYATEGWGLTQDGSQLIMSDGTSWLYFLDTQTFMQKRSFEVRDNNNPINNLNELEFIKGKIFANVWKTDKIAIIDPQSGSVEAWLDLTGLLQPGDYAGQVDVLNGIAYDGRNDRIFVTGKYWPLVFEIELMDIIAK